MLETNPIAFKEWAVICTALASGKQILILRKGGIQESGGQFHVDHDQFWLFPTYSHQGPPEIVPQAQSLLDTVLADRPPDGLVRIRYYAVVHDAAQVRDPKVLPQLVGHHIWSQDTVDKRFHYRQPGLVALLVRVYQLSEAIELPDSPYFAGCRSWVQLPHGLSTMGAEPVLGDAEFVSQATRLQAALSPIRLA